MHYYSKSVSRHRRKAQVRFTVSSATAVGLLSSATVGLLLYGQQVTGNPFLDRSDTGDIVHVLPGPASIHPPYDTQPTYAPRSGQTTFAASYGSGNLIDHGGNVMNAPNFYAVYW